MTMVFNVENGTIDTRTGRIKPTVGDLITSLPVTFDPAACPPLWDQFQRPSA